MNICDLSAWVDVVIVDAKATRDSIANVCNQKSDSSSIVVKDNGLFKKPPDIPSMRMMMEKNDF